MKLRQFFLIPLLALSLASCGPVAKVGEFVSAVTTTITNPVGQVDIYRAKNVYAATLELVVAYREFCWSKPYAALMADPIARPICQNRRPVVRALQRADNKAFAALGTAENFVRNNPTLNAASAIGAAWAAVTDYQNLATRTAIVAR